ncbi:MAG: hypothetical protein ACYCPO_05590 [Acidobacteriaceae bacterium]
MKWFGDKLDDEIKKLSADAAAAYAERAKLSVQLLLIKPNLSANEMAVLWAAGAGVMAEADANGSQDDSELLLWQITRDFFDSFCQSYINNIAKAHLMLSLDSEEIRNLISPLCSQMTKERGDNVIYLTRAILSNAANLSRTTLAILNRGWCEKDANRAKSHARSLVKSSPGLNAHEKAWADEGLAKVNWSTSQDYAQEVAR